MVLLSPVETPAESIWRMACAERLMAHEAWDNATEQARRDLDRLTSKTSPEDRQVAWERYRKAIEPANEHRRQALVEAEANRRSALRSIGWTHGTEATCQTP